jgi:cellulose synthase/poly-beta-1,6-N-acetylglucosamine synthase-like glycosyltransferase
MQWLLLIILIPYIYILLRIYTSLAKIKSYYLDSNAEIFVSVIVACRNEDQNLPTLLKNISLQNYNPDLFEVIIVDDNSSDKTFSTAAEFKGVKNLIVLKNQGEGKKQAIRTGVAASSGKLIITTDADCRFGDKWLRTINSFYAENKPDMVICPVELEGGRSFFHRFQELEFLSLQGITAGTAASGNPVMCNGANLAFTKETYNEHSENLHDELPTGDDVFLLHGIKKKPGNKIMWLESADAIAITRSSETLSSFLRQRARWISKAGSYSDRFTQVLAIVTFVTILLEWFLLIAGIFNPVFFLVLLTALLLKAVPDYLILRNTFKRYGKKSLLWLFFTSQIIYPVYVISVFFCYLIGVIKYHAALVK